MKAIIYITSVHGNPDTTSLVVSYHVDNSVMEHISSEIVLPTTLTDTQFNQAVLDDARSKLELAAGTIFEVGDELLLVNSMNLLKSTVQTKTDDAIINAPSLNDQLSTLLGAE